MARMESTPRVRSSRQAALVRTTHVMPHHRRFKTLRPCRNSRRFSSINRGNTASETRPGAVSVTATYDGHGRLTGYTRTGESNLVHI
jgi:YD repeat-containing protein